MKDATTIEVSFNERETFEVSFNERETLFIYLAGTLDRLEESFEDEYRPRAAEDIRSLFEKLDLIEDYNSRIKK
jgi:hypothetical protein